MASAGPNPMIALEPFDEESGTLNVIIDTPKGSRNKFKYDERSEIFKLGTGEYADDRDAQSNRGKGGL
jgi:inorganic pyrophosphatase